GEAVEPSYVFRALTAMGEVVSLQISAVAIEWEGRPATLNFLTDVTEQVKLAAHLAATLAEREAVLETTAVGIMFIQNGRIKWINDALEQTMLGFDDAEIIGRTGEVAFKDHADWSRFLKDCIPALEACGTYEGDWEVQRKDGSPWWCHMSSKALNPARLGEGTIWFFLDISLRRRAAPWCANASSPSSRRASCRSPRTSSAPRSPRSSRRSSSSRTSAPTCRP